MRFFNSAVLCIAMLGIIRYGWTRNSSSGLLAVPLIQATDTAASAKKPTVVADTGKAATAVIKDTLGKALRTVESDTAAAPTKEQAPLPESNSGVDYKKMGDLFTKKGDAEKAMEAYKQFLDKKSKDPSAEKIAKAVGEYCYAQKQYEDAVRYLSMVKGKERMAPAFRLMLGRSLHCAGKSKSAITMLEPLAVTKGLPIALRREVYRTLGDACVKADQPKKALSWYEKYLGAGGVKNRDISFAFASLLEAASPAKAKVRYEQNIRSFPNDYRNYLRLGLLMSKDKTALKRSAALLKKAAELADTVATAWLEIARLYGRLGKTDDELAAYEQCARFDTANLEAKTRIGTIFLRKGVTGEAIRFLEAAYKQAPDSGGTISALAAGYIQGGRIQEGIELLTKAKTQRPTDPAVRKGLYQAYLFKGQDQLALEEIKSLLELKRDNESLLLYGKLLLKLGKLDSAANVMEDIRATAPDNIEALMTLGSILRTQKKYNEAIEIYKEVCSIDMKCAPAQFERAEVYLAQSKVNWAEQFYQRALDIDPKMATAVLGLAKVALMRKNRQGYLDFLDKAAAMEPENPLIKQELENSKKPSKAGAGGK